MRRKNKLIFALCIAFAMATLVLGLDAFADEKKAAELDEYIQEYAEKSEKTAELLSFGGVLERVKSAFGECFSTSLPLFYSMLCFVIVCAVANAFSKNLVGGEICEYVGALCFSGSVFYAVISLCKGVEGFSRAISQTIATILPTLLAVGVAEGAEQARVGYSGLSIGISAAEFLIGAVIIPCIKLLLALIAASSLAMGELDLSGITSSIRSFCIFSVSLCMTAIVVLMNFQSIVARATDSIALRGIRFVSVSLVPIVGNLLGESAKTVKEALTAVKSLSGAVGAAGIIAACIPPIVAIVVLKLELIVCNCVAKTLGCQGQSRVINEICGILNVLNAAVIACTVGFLSIICILASAV